MNLENLTEAEIRRFTGCSMRIYPNGEVVVPPWPQDTDHYKRHIEKLENLHGTGDCLTRTEFDDYVSAIFFTDLQVGRSELLMLDELTTLASEEQDELAHRIARGAIAQFEIEEGEMEASSERLRQIEEGNMDRDLISNLTFSESEHDLWYKS